MNKNLSILPKNIGKTDFIALIALATILLGAILRVVIRTSTSLWEDEIIAATHASQSFLGSIVDSFVNDLHPPLYFTELHIWSRISSADMWLIANSVLFSLLALASLYYVVRRLSDQRRALAITAVFAVLPVPLWMAGEVRMYAMMGLFYVWLYYFTQRLFAEGKYKKSYLIGATLFAIAIIWSHAIGFVAVLFYGLYGFAHLIRRRAARQEWLNWLLVFGVAGVTAMPLIAADMFHPADMPPVSNFQDFLNWMSGVVVGTGFLSLKWLRLAGLKAFVATVVFGLIVKRTRIVTLCFLIAPLALCMAVDLAARPLFKTNFFSDYYALFLALVIGDVILAVRGKAWVRGVLFASVLGALLLMAVANREVQNASTAYYKKAAAVINAGKQPSDVVWAPQGDIFWGMAWYLAGPDWGSPSAINVMPRPQSKWWKVYDILGPAFVKKFQLIPKAQSITTKDGMKLVIGIPMREAVEQEKRVWLVTYAPRNDVPPDLPGDSLGPLQRAESYSFPPLQVNLYVPPAANEGGQNGQ